MDKIGWRTCDKIASRFGEPAVEHEDITAPEPAVAAVEEKLLEFKSQASKIVTGSVEKVRPAFNRRVR
jgi:hypothetical protein